MSDLVGKKAPAITLQDQDGVERAVEDYKGQYVLVYFYPKDNTPGCTTEACELRDRMNDAVELGLHVLGVSADSIESHKKFATKHQLEFPLLADTEREMIKAYGVWKQKKMFGKEYMGISRESFLIDPEGVVVMHYPKVKPAKHAQEVLEEVQKRTA